jgi:uncharacterized protein YecE (DUF72 family)
MDGKILIGTASWTDHEPFYPPEVTGTDRLAWYAERFPYVEIDSSFYRVPGSRMTAGWVQRTPEDFVMGIKAHKSMTLHERQDGVPVPPSEATIRDFENALYPIRESGKLGAILYRWPPLLRLSQGCHMWVSGTLPVPASTNTTRWVKGRGGSGLVRRAGPDPTIPGGGVIDTAQ